MSMINKLKVAVIGATGYTGLELVYFLSRHPKVKINYLCATKNLGKEIAFLIRELKKNYLKLHSQKISIGIISTSYFCHYQMVKRRRL